MEIVKLEVHAIPDEGGFTGTVRDYKGDIIATAMSKHSDNLLALLIDAAYKVIDAGGWHDYRTT